MRKLLLGGLLLLLAACGMPPAAEPVPEELRDSDAPLTTELRERRQVTMIGMIQATKLEPFDVILQKDDHTLSAKIKGLGNCTASLVHSYSPGYGSKRGGRPESASFSFEIFNNNGTSIWEMSPTGAFGGGFNPTEYPDLKDKAELRHCSEEPAK